jgi:hypothetical protein
MKAVLTQTGLFSGFFRTWWLPVGYSQLVAPPVVG